MRVRYFVPFVALGAAVLIRRIRVRRRELPIIPAPDPKDPVQSFDDSVPWHVEELAVDALPEVEGEALDELASLEPELDRPREPPIRDAGDLYGVHVTPAVDRSHPDDDAAQATGENWLEALREDSVEKGPEPERTLDMTDDSDITTPSSDTRDRPIADRGSGGPRGL